MSKEINLFELQSEEQTKPSPQQLSLPGMENTIESGTDLNRETRFKLKRIIEALLFASTEPLPLTKIREITDTFHPAPPRILKAILEELQDEYYAQQRAFQLDEIAQGFTFRSTEKYSKYIELLGRNKRGEKLSHASAEVLAIIAYKQPITRPQIEAIRGVDSSGIVASLLERQLIQPVGKLEAPGRPTLYGITKEFLKHFGLKDVKELPKIEN